MPKRTGNSSVNSSIRQNTTATNEGFQQLLDLQSLSNDHLESIRELMANSLLTQKDDNVKNKSIEKENARQQKELENTTTVLKESLKIQQQLLASQNAASIAIATTIKTFKSFGDKFQDFKANMRDNFSSISKALLSTKIVKPGSMVDKLLGVSKRVARDDFVDRQKLLGSTKSKSELREDYKKASRVAKDIQKADTDIEVFKRKTGLNEEQMANTKAGKELLDRKSNLGNEYSKHDLAAQVAKDSIKDTRGHTMSKEDHEEAIRLQEEQITALKEVVENTKPHHDIKPNAASAGGEAGGGIFASLAGGIGLMGSALAKLGRGIGTGLEKILQGLARGFAYFFNPATLVGMGAFTLAALGIGKALEMAAPFIEAFAPVLIKVADVIQTVFMGAIEKIPEVITAIGDVIYKVINGISDAITGIIDSVVTAIERLGAVDGSNLLQVGAGLLSIGAGLAAFGAGTAVAGVGNLVGGLLSAVSGQKSPIEQLEQIAKLGPGLQQAGLGIEKLSAGLSGFSSTDGSKVSKMSEQASAMKDSAANASSNTVVAPSITNNTKQTQVAKIDAPVRSNDSSVDRYFLSRARYI